MDPIVDTPHKPTTGDADKVCGDCGTHNASTSDYCLVCGGELAVASVSDGVVENTPSQARICPRCTFHNPVLAVRCEMCQTVLTTVFMQSSSQSSQGTMGPPPSQRGRRKHHRPSPVKYPNSQLGRSSDLSWTDATAPETYDEVAVHPKKKDEIRQWLVDAFTGIHSPTLLSKPPPVLLLTGPPGSGKTSLIRALARDNDLPLCHWAEPDNEAWSARPTVSDVRLPYTSVPRAFQHFLVSAGRYGDVFNSLSHAPLPSDQRLLLVDDILSIANSRSYDSVVNAIAEYSRAPLVPLIILAETSEAADLRSTRFLTDLGNTPGVRRVKLNPLAQTLAVKALKAVMAKMDVPADKKLLTQIAEASCGDLRQAINALQFHHLPSSRSKRETDDFFASGVDPLGPKGGRHGRKRKRAAGGEKLKGEDDKGNKSVLHTGDHSLSLFHALGRILYAKRLEDGSLKSNPETVLSEGGAEADPHSFLAFLHQNYCAFLDSGVPESIEDAAQSMEAQSRAELFLSEKWQTPIATQYGLSVAARGIIHASRHPTRPKFGSMYGPVGSKVFRVTRESKHQLLTHREQASIVASRLPTLNEMAMTYAPMITTPLTAAYTTGSYQVRQFDQPTSLSTEGQLRVGDNSRQQQYHAPPASGGSARGSHGVARTRTVQDIGDDGGDGMVLDDIED